MNGGDALREHQDSRRPLLPYRVAIFALLPLLVVGLLAAASAGFHFGSAVAGIVCLLFAALNVARLVVLIRLGKEGWETRARRGR